MQALTRSGAGTSSAAETVRLADFAAAHTVGLTRFAYVLCGDRGLAEDLVQDAFMAMYRRFGDTLDVAAPVAYARRTILNANTSRARRLAGNEPAVADLPEAAQDAVDHAEQDSMWRALATLPARQRSVLVLRYYLDLPDGEIADALGCRQSSVRSLASRALAALRSRPELGGLS